MPNDMSNTPVLDLTSALAPDKIAAWLEYEYAKHLLRKTALLMRHEKFLAVTNDGINDDVMAGHASDFKNDLKDEIADMNATRSRIKAPVLHAQRLIDGEAKKMTDALGMAMSQVLARLTDYLRRKEAEERAAAEMEAARLALAAQEAMELADQVNTPSAIDAAVLAVQEAQLAEIMATARPVELTRTRSQAGSLTGLKDNWQYRVVDISAVPAVYLTVNDVMIKAAMKSAGKSVGDLRIPGIEFFNDARAFVR